VHAALPHLAVVCWRGLVLDHAAKAFSKGFYGALAAGTNVPIAAAVAAGEAKIEAMGFTQGDPEAWFHPRDHPHMGAEHRAANPSWRQCRHCNPPAHGEVVFVARGRTATAPPERSSTSP
jgi:hypothetical protein